MGKRLNLPAGEGGSISSSSHLYGESSSIDQYLMHGKTVEGSRLVEQRIANPISQVIFQTTKEDGHGIML
jgi:hypothetical protein